MVHDSTECLVVSYPLKRPREFALLSIAEIDVVEGVLQGMSQRAIAQRQGVAPRTIANQLASAYRKLGVTDLVDLAIRCSLHSQADRLT